MTKIIGGRPTLRGAGERAPGESLSPRRPPTTPSSTVALTNHGFLSRIQTCAGRIGPRRRTTQPGGAHRQDRRACLCAITKPPSGPWPARSKWSSSPRRPARGHRRPCRHPSMSILPDAGPDARPAHRVDDGPATGQGTGAGFRLGRRGGRAPGRPVSTGRPARSAFHAPLGEDDPATLRRHTVQGLVTRTGGRPTSRRRPPMSSTTCRAIPRKARPPAPVLVAWPCWTRSPSPRPGTACRAPKPSGAPSRNPSLT